MSDSLDAIVGSFPDFPDCQDPFTERAKEIDRTRDRFAHLDRVLRECAASDDPIYRTAAALWEAVSGPANRPSSLFRSERQRTEDKVKRLVRRFNRDDKASIAHALMHLETNKIADDDYPGHSGWYCGNREQFVKRHKKAVALMRSLLEPNIPICVKSGAERDGEG